MKTKIKTSDFNELYSQSIANDKDISDWPVVYIINNDEEAYVGETVNMPNRAAQHWANENRRRLNTINVIRNDEFNKSAILDLESFLIKYMSADEKFKLQNGNAGISDHNYFDRARYESQFESIWELLREKKLTKKTLTQIENSDLFKYSPYKALSADQYSVMFNILKDLYEHKEELADVLVYCRNMLDVLELDEDEIVNAKMERNEKKYPVEKAKGNAAKYDKL